MVSGLGRRHLSTVRHCRHGLHTGIRPLGSGERRRRTDDAGQSEGEQQSVDEAPHARNVLPHPTASQGVEPSGQNPACILRNDIPTEATPVIQTLGPLADWAVPPQRQAISAFPAIIAAPKRPQRLNRHGRLWSLIILPTGNRSAACSPRTGLDKANGRHSPARSARSPCAAGRRCPTPTSKAQGFRS